MSKIGDFSKTLNFKYILLGIFGLSTVLGSYTIIEPGKRGVMVTLGKPSDYILDEGPHFKYPFIQEVKQISVRVQKTEAAAEAATKDIQRVTVRFAVNWHIDPKTVNEMFRNIGNEKDIDERIIHPAISEVLKAATAKMTAEEVLTKRLELKDAIDNMIVTRLARYNVIVKDVSLVDLNFTTEFNRAVEKKQVAEQEAMEAVYTAKQAEQEAIAVKNRSRGEADARLINAESQAKSQKLLQQSLTKDILTLKWLEKWNGNLPQVLTGANGNVMMMLNTNTKTKEKENE